MKRGILNAGTRVSSTRAPAHFAGLSTAVSRKPSVERKPRTLAERLKRQQPDSSNPLISSSGEVITRTQVKTTQLFRSLHEAVTPPLYGAGDQIIASGWKPEDWKDDWGTDDSKRQKPPHIGVAPNQPSFPFKKRTSAPTKRAIAYTRRIEGLIDPSDKPVLEDLVPTTEHKPIATLEHGLERVLFNPGVHWLQDPRSRVYNFSPHLETLPKVTEFAFERLPGFIKSSRDEDLRTLAKRENRMFAGSTSSLTGMLSHCYFLISEHKPVDISSLSQYFYQEVRKKLHPRSADADSVIFNYKDGVYAIDSDSEDTSKNVLTWLGTLLEKFLTMSKAEFATYLRSTPALVEKQEDLMREAYRYAKSEKFVMRSQLDCVDRRLPGTGVFDIKTRACLPENSGYLIKSGQGLLESFEREYYDLIRSAFLKYGFQVRIGNMDGVIVAYHNTARLFGFQYISLEEMDQRLFGPEPGTGDRIFQKCVGLLECIVPEIVQCFPNESVKCTFECEEGSKELNVWVQPAEWVSTREDDSEPPMRQISIRAKSFINESPVNGSRAIMGSSTAPWTIHWVISHLSDDQEEIRDNFGKCMERKFRAYSIPTGVSFEDLPQYWSELNFGNEPKPEAEQNEDQPRLPEDFDYSKFRIPDERVKSLRDLARSGRVFSAMLEKREAGRKKIVLGEPYDISDIEMETYRSEEDRDIEADGSSAAGVSNDELLQSSDSTGFGLPGLSDDPVISDTTSTADSMEDLFDGQVEVADPTIELSDAEDFSSIESAPEILPVEEAQDDLAPDDLSVDGDQGSDPHTPRI
ncbi:mitochondrial protein Pet127-domain-containing protein [Mycena haematopus]|nr:mitochondrial protein Pet127-domain-containing protein [Mycena haematopus]